MISFHWLFKHPCIQNFECTSWLSKYKRICVFYVVIYFSVLPQHNYRYIKSFMVYILGVQLLFHGCIIVVYNNQIRSLNFYIFKVHNRLILVHVRLITTCSKRCASLQHTSLFFDCVTFHILRLLMQRDLDIWLCVLCIHLLFFIFFWMFYTCKECLKSPLLYHAITPDCIFYVIVSRNCIFQNISMFKYIYICAIKGNSLK